ncbi:MAG: hypothetical protein V7K89_07755 [Nostoc sp.]
MEDLPWCNNTSVVWITELKEIVTQNVAFDLTLHFLFLYQVDLQQ